MKTRTKKLQYNVTKKKHKKKHKKISRKKKIYKNKTKRGGNPLLVQILIPTALGLTAVGVGGWFIKRSLQASKEKPKKNKAEKPIYEGDDDDIDDIFGPDDHSKHQGTLEFLDLRGFTPPHRVRETDEGRQPIYEHEGDEIILRCKNIKEQTKKIFETYYYENEYFKDFTRKLREMNEQIDKPKVGGVLLMHNEFLETPLYKKQIESYIILGAYIPAESKAEAQGLQKAAPIKRQQILYEDNNNYYCIDNTYQIDKDFMIKLESFRRNRRGGSRVEPQSSDKILDYLTIDGVAEDSSKDPSVKGKMKNVFGTLLSYFLSTGSNTAAATLIFDFYNENIELLQDSDDFKIITTFILNETAYKEYIETKGTNARKKIELLNLISSNTICKFLMDFLVQELPPSDGITEGTETYKLVSESIRINWRINNIYGENKQEKPPDGHNLYLKEGAPRDKYLINPVYVGGVTDAAVAAVAAKAARAARRKRAAALSAAAERAAAEEADKERERRADRKADFETIHEREAQITAAKYIPFIKKYLETLVSKKQIPYEVLLVLLGLILSDNEDIIEEEKILAVNIIYNEIVRYGSQDLYDIPIEGSAINTRRPHRDQAALMQRPVIAIPKIELNRFISDKTIISAFGSRSDTVAVYGAVDNLMTNLKFGEFVEEYFTTLVHNCKGKSEKDILEIEKKALYSIFYFTLKGTDKEWKLKGETTINKFRKNLEILLPKVDFSKLTLDTFKEFAKVDWELAHPDTGTPRSKIADSIKLIIMNRLYKLLEV